MKNLAKNFLLTILIFLFISAVFSLFYQPFEKLKELSISQLVQEINQEKIKKIKVSGNELEIIYQDETRGRSRKETGVELWQTLVNWGASQEKLNKVEIEIEREKEGSFAWLGWLVFGILPLLLFGVFFWMIFRQAKTGSGQIFDFTRVKPKFLGPGGQIKEKVTFEEVGGLKEAKEELKEIVDFLKNPKKYLQIGARIPRGVLLMGPPGTGKTLLAKAIASQANVAFFSISGSEFVELFVGIGSSITGDTPVLIRTKNFTKLLPIREFVDQFFSENKEGFVRVFDIKTLGYKPLETRAWGVSKKAKTKFFGKSCWQEIKGVYRHKVNEIYEIHYLGGVIKTTGDHSIFVRHRNFIFPKKVSELKVGEVLVNLPLKVRGVFIPGVGTTHKIKAHEFLKEIKEKELTVWHEEFQLEKTQKMYEMALANQGKVSQSELVKELGACQMTVSNGQQSRYQPQIFLVAKRYFEKEIPQKVKITPSLMRLFGYYTAEGRREDCYLEFVFGAHETKLHQDCIALMQEIFNAKPYLRYTEDNSLRITYHSKFLGDFFEKHCGTEFHNKHIPEFLWDLPKEYFLDYLDGLAKNDGWIRREGKLIIGSTSQQLISELIWLAAMHGIKVGVKKKKSKGGRITKNKPLLKGDYWVLIIGKPSHPFLKKRKSPYQLKPPIVRKIIKKPHDGYVYDLCGCENEAFFGGEKPILLHNSRIRNLFEQARKAGRAIIFIDEIDSIGKIRGVGVTGGHEEREQTLNQLLSEMDGIGREEGVLVFAATNRPEYLDPALLRPGRFDRRIVLDLPDVNEREEILKIHCRGKPLAFNVNLKEVAERTPGFSGADLANVVNEAAILAARKNKHQIYQEEILEAIEKVLLGPERKSHILSKKEKEIAAYHEAGHALVASSLPEAEPVRKISIIARGLAAGYTLKIPREERKIKTKTEFLAEMATLLGGYCAEKIKFGEISTGAANDLEKASFIAGKMVKEYGMSSLGPISLGEKEELAFLGTEFERRTYSEEVAAKIDKEIEKFVKNAEDAASQILNKKRNLLEKIAKRLIEKETIEKEEFEELIKEKKKPLKITKKSFKVKVEKI